MNNLEKMNELVNGNATKTQVMTWAYMNRIWVCNLPSEEEFGSMENSVGHFIDTYSYSGDESENWDKFLDVEYVE